MAETSGASTAVNKRLKCEEEEEEGEEEKEDDLISELPGCIIQHILSFLPSTKDAIRTGVLSKRWLNQWTHVPILIFKYDGTSIENFSELIDDTLNLYNCSKITKFVINLKHTFFGELHRKLTRWIHFAATRDVQELILECEHEHPFFEYKPSLLEYYDLPQFLFENTFLVKLKTHGCQVIPQMGNVNWSSLKALCISSAYLPNQAIESVLSSSPVIEYLEFDYCFGFGELVIASTSLKTLCMFQSGFRGHAIEISCPNLEKLEILGEMWLESIKFKGLPASVCATLDFENDAGWPHNRLGFVKEFLLQVQHVEDLTLGPWFLKFLTVAAVRGESTLLLNNKCLTVIDPFSEVRQPALPLSHLRFGALEKLVIRLDSKEMFDMMGITTVIAQEFSGLDRSVFESLVSHLKVVNIVGFHYISKHTKVLKFVVFLLKNARMLEKMVFLEADGSGMIYSGEVCKKLSCIRKASPHAIVKVAYMKLHDSDWDNIDC